MIEANFVTLDLAGNTIIGPGLGNGILADLRHDTKVHSGTVTNFHTGVALAGNGHTVEYVRAINNTFDGIAVGIGSGHRIVGNVANDNGVAGIYVGACPAAVLHNVAKGNVIDILTDTFAVNCTRLGNSPLP